MMIICFICNFFNFLSMYFFAGTGPASAATNLSTVCDFGGKAPFATAGIWIGSFGSIG